MPTTTNYGFILPDVGGSSGAWGGILNDAIDDIDGTIKTVTDALDTRVDAIEAEVNGALSVTSLAAAAGITAVGDIVSSSNQVRGVTVVGSMPAAANGALAGIANFNGGADGALGPVAVAIGVFPSAVGASRFAQLSVADNTALRKFGLVVSQCYVGTAAVPAFIGSEMLRVAGLTRSAGVTLDSGTFNGSGADLTNIPLAAVSGLTGAIGGLQSDVSTLDSRVDAQDILIAGKMDTGAGISATQLTSGTIPGARYGAAFGYAAQAPTGVSGGRNAVLTNSAGNTNSELYGMSASLNDVVGNLINDLKSRGVI